VLGRIIGSIGHQLGGFLSLLFFCVFFWDDGADVNDDFFRSKRLKATLYCHPANDIFIEMSSVSHPRILGRVQ